MKKFIAKKLVALGIWLCQEVGNIPEIDGYAAGKIALGLSIKYVDIYDYQRKTNKKWNECIGDLIKARKARIRVEICKKIDHLIEYKINKEGKDINVRGDVKVYIPYGKKI